MITFYKWNIINKYIHISPDLLHCEVEYVKLRMKERNWEYIVCENLIINTQLF